MNRANILVVEDERIVARDLQTTLRRAGYDVPGLAASGEDALSLAEKIKPDLILMDIVLQGEMDGITAAGLIREHLGIPVIYLSSYGDQAVLERAKATEPIGYVLKPYEEKDLLTTIQVVLHQYQTSRQRAESALLASEARFRSIFETAPWGMALVNREGGLMESNPAWQQMFGYEAAKLAEKDFAELVHAEDRAIEVQLFRDVFEGRRGHSQSLIRGIRLDGAVIWLRSIVCLFPSDEPGGGRRFAFCMAQDVTEEKTLQEQFLRAQRMESIGTMTSGLAHNLNNLLTPATMGVALLRAGIRDEPTVTLLDTMETSLQRAAGIIRQLLDFGRGGQGNLANLPADRIVREVMQLVRELFPRSVVTHARLPAGVWSVRGDANQLHQALLNLCTNARDAMPAGGNLTLAAENAQIDTDQARLHPGAIPGPCVILTVTDTGAGMAREVIDRIFEPFFTTKPLGLGTGLGLLSTLNIIKRHGGFIEIQSAPNEGTEFRLYLPAIRTEESREKPKC